MSFTDILIIFVPIIIILIIIAVSVSFIFRVENVSARHRSEKKMKNITPGMPLPKNVKSQQDLANYYYENGDYVKAAQIYSVLIGNASVNRKLDGFNISLRYGISLMKTGHLDQAYKYVAARQGSICTGQKNRRLFRSHRRRSGCTYFKSQRYF